MTLRRLWMGLSTILNIDQQGFFIPYRYAESTDAPLRYPAVESAFQSAAPAFEDLITSINRYGPELSQIGSDPAPAPRFEQDWFPRLDACALYAVVRAFGPRRIIEVGSGHSTRFAARAVADGRLATRITAIDPAPRASIETLKLQVIRKTVQAAGLGVFADLEAGDVLFIDSSHILMPGTDVDVLFNIVIPALPAGVLIHIHDMTLPDIYPHAWVWRAYNEQQAVVPMITSGGFDVLWSSHYVATRMGDALIGTVIERLPLMDGALETSLWLRKR